jgi:hypothetical protein
MKLASAMAAAAMIALVAPASAATVTVLGFVKKCDSYPNIAPDAQSGRVDLNVTGPQLNVYADIYQDTTLAGIGAYNSVRTGGSLTSNLMGKAGDFFALILGTVATYNTLTINNVGGGTEPVDGNAILNLPGYLAGLSNVIVKITADFDFDSATLTSSGNSVEHAFNPPELAPIPVPAAGLPLVGGLGLLGAAARRRKA